MHLFFDHDFTHRVTFDLSAELAKGDHESEMAALFPKNTEYERLLGFKTPFHQRWFWWSVVVIGVFSLLSGLWAFAMMLIWIVACIRARRLLAGLPWLAVGVESAVSIFLCGALLMVEGVYYFGLADATDRIHPALKWSPWLLLACTVAVSTYLFKHARNKVLLRVHLATQSLLIIALVYWGALAF